MAAILPIPSDGYLSSQNVRQPNQLPDVRARGTLSADEVALSSALDDIDRSLNGAGTDGRANNAVTLSPDDLRSKISDLISDEVKNGKLSNDQATDLQSMLDDAFDGGPTDLSFSDDSDDDLLGQREFATDFSAAKDTSTLLQDFLKSAGDQDSQSNYDAAGSSSTVSSRGALLLNYKA